MLESVRDALVYVEGNKDWIFGGIGVSLIGLIGAYLFKPFGRSTTSVSPHRNTSTNTNNITINNTPLPGSGNSDDSKKKTCTYTADERKRMTKILFIDDDTSFKVVPILKKSGWINTRIVKGVKGPDDKSIMEADICFIDIIGVAADLFEKDQGLGLVGAVKDRHPEKKVVVYSSQEEGDVFNELWDKADAKLPKNAEPYQFENLLELFSEEIYC